MSGLVKVTKEFKCLARESDIHPKSYMPDDIVAGFPAEVALRNDWGVAVAGQPNDSEGGESDSSSGDQDPAGAATSPDQDPDPDKESTVQPVLRAKLLRSVDVEIEGEVQKLAKGAVVEGEIADRLIKEKVARQIAAETPPETR